MEEDYGVLESAVRQTFAGVVWSHKIQEKQADIFAKRFKRMELVKIAASSLTSVGIVSLLMYSALSFSSTISLKRLALLS